MSKILKLLLLLGLLFALAACGGNGNGNTTNSTGETDTSAGNADTEEVDTGDEDAGAEAPEEDTTEEDTSAEAPASDLPGRGDIRIIVVSHGQASDPFWSVVKNGVDQASEDMGVNVDYQAPQTFDMVAMAELIEAAVAANPDGIVVSIPDADALGDAIRGAVEAGIPVISMNSGSDVAKDLGILVHVGQTEYEAGLGGGRRMGAEGVTNGLCINQEVGNVALDLRCQGFADGLAETGGTSEVLAVDLADPVDAQERISGRITGGEFDGVLALGPTGAAPALAALEEAGLLGELSLATFDLSPEVLEAVRDGNMLFAIDQQQYLQGYLPIVLLTLFNTNLNTIANDVLLTGPGFVTQDTAAAVIGLSAEGTR